VQPCFPWGEKKRKSDPKPTEQLPDVDPATAADDAAWLKGIRRDAGLTQDVTAEPETGNEASEVTEPATGQPDEDIDRRQCEVLEAIGEAWATEPSMTLLAFLQRVCMWASIGFDEPVTDRELARAAVAWAERKAS
jgi:hypothetical protein